MAELLPRMQTLAALARGYDIGFNIDAEEVDRLELSLDLLQSLAEDPALDRWNGLGFVVQAYGKRCPLVIDLARRTGRRMMVQLVKGAYWDAEIKRAQVDGLADYPVYTRKIYTDVAYVSCARKLLAARDAVFPQFATNNARTLATIYQLAGPDSARAITSSSACTAWASCSMTRWSARTKSTAHAGSMRRSGRTRRCSPIWCGACWKIAPTPRSSTASAILPYRSRS